MSFKAPFLIIERDSNSIIATRVLQMSIFEQLRLSLANQVYLHMHSLCMLLREKET